MARRVGGVIVRASWVGKAKDVAAGAVLLAAVGAGIIGVLVFGPRVSGLFR